MSPTPFTGFAPAEGLPHPADPVRCDAGFEFRIWHKAQRVRCWVLDVTLERLAGMPVKRDAQLVAVDWRHRRRLHEVAREQIDLGVDIDPVRLDPELFDVPLPAERKPDRRPIRQRVASAPRQRRGVSAGLPPSRST